jgi:predicted esterase
MKVLWLLIFSISQLAFAQLENNRLFKKKGSRVITELSLKNYLAQRSLLYYIPNSLDLNKPTKVVIYLHGGNSNMTQERALEVADTLFWGTVEGPFARKEGIRPIADRQQFIVIMPTTTTGWLEFTPFYLRELLGHIRRELNPDPDKIFLMGHSMGAMGICRSVSKLADEFAMFFPMSGGFQPHLKNFSDTGPLYNTKVYMTSGSKYEYPHFISWNEEFRVFLDDEYVRSFFGDKAPDWEFIQHDGTHNPNLKMMEEKLREFTTEVKRDLYQPDLFGSVFTAKSTPGYILDNHSLRYFWLEAREFRPFDENETGIGVNFRLYSKENVITLKIDRPTTYRFDTRSHLKKIRLHLSEKLFNLDHPITVKLITKRGVADYETTNFHGLVTRSPVGSDEVIKKSGDKGFKFEAFLDLELPRN